MGGAARLAAVVVVVKLVVDRNRILIVPESKTDEAYIEEVLELREEGDTVECRRVNAHGLSAIAYVRIKQAERADF
jgi:hypothetical protein